MYCTFMGFPSNSMKEWFERAVVGVKNGMYQLPTKEKQCFKSPPGKATSLKLLDTVMSSYVMEFTGSSRQEIMNFELTNNADDHHANDVGYEQDATGNVRARPGINMECVTTTNVTT